MRALLLLQCLVPEQSCQQVAAGDTCTYGCHSTCRCSIGHTLLSCRPGRSFQDFCRLCRVTVYSTRCFLGDQRLREPWHENCHEVALRWTYWRSSTGCSSFRPDEASVVSQICLDSSEGSPLRRCCCTCRLSWLDARGCTQMLGILLQFFPQECSLVGVQEVKHALEERYRYAQFLVIKGAL